MNQSLKYIVLVLFTLKYNPVSQTIQTRGCAMLVNSICMVYIL